MLDWTVGALASVLALGCVVSSKEAGELPDSEDAGADGTQDDDDDDDDTDGRGGTGPSDGTVGDDDDDDDDDTMGDDDDDDTMGDDDDDDDSTDDGPVDACDPVGLSCEPSGPAFITFAIDGLPTDELLEIDETCDLSGDVGPGPGGGSQWTVTAECPTGTYDITIEASLETTEPLALDATGAVRYRQQLVDEINLARQLVLTQADGQIAFAGIDLTDISELTPMLISPLVLDVEPTECPGENTEFELLTQDAVVAFELGDDTAMLYSGGEGVMGDYAVVSGEVERFLCDPRDFGYNYATWFVRAGVFLL